MTSSQTRPGAAIEHGWRHKSHVLDQFNIGHTRLSGWVDEGYVRSVKLDERQQGRRLYATVDVEATITALCAGKEPRRNAGRRAEA